MGDREGRGRKRCDLKKISKGVIIASWSGSEHCLGHAIYI